MLNKILEAITLPFYQLTKLNKAENAIRDLFLSRLYAGRIPAKDMGSVLTSQRWARIYGKKEIAQAWRGLIDDGYVWKEGNFWQWNVEGKFTSRGFMLKQLVEILENIVVEDEASRVAAKESGLTYVGYGVYKDKEGQGYRWDGSDFKETKSGDEDGKEGEDEGEKEKDGKKDNRSGVINKFFGDREKSKIDPKTDYPGDLIDAAKNSSGGFSIHNKKENYTINYKYSGGGKFKVVTIDKNGNTKEDEVDSKHVQSKLSKAVNTSPDDYDSSYFA